jgi:hypothetical protein
MRWPRIAGGVVIALVIAGATNASADPVGAARATPALLDRVREEATRQASVRFNGRVQTAKPPRDSVKNGVLIGGAVGLGYGIGVAIALDHGGELGVERAIMLPLTTAAAGAGLGYLVDVLKH